MVIGIDDGKLIYTGLLNKLQKARLFQKHSKNLTAL